MSYKASPYRILGIDSNASPDDIKSAYHSLAKKWHPDLYRGNKEYAEEQFKRIKQAYEELGTPVNNHTRIPTNNSYQSVSRSHFPLPRVPFSGPNIFARQACRRCPNPAPNSTGANASVLCNGTVLLSGGFHPSNLTADMLQRMQQNTNPSPNTNTNARCNSHGCYPR